MFNPFRRNPKPAPVELAAKPAAGRNLYADQARDDALISEISRLPEPDEVLKKSGLNRAALRVLETDPEIFGAMQTRRERVISTPWSLDPYTEAPGELLIWDQLDRHVYNILRAGWDAIPYGYSVPEAVYKRIDGGRIGIKSFTGKPLEWFEPTREGGLKYTDPLIGGGIGVEVDTDFKFFHVVRDPSYRNPYGEALHTRLYWLWHFRQSAWKWRLQRLERHADPIIAGQIGDMSIMDEHGKSSADYFVDGALKMGFRSVLGVGRDDKITPISVTTGDDFEQFENGVVRIYNRVWLGHPDIAMSISGRLGGDTMAERIFDMQRAADIRLLAPMVQRVINALWELNRIEENRLGLPRWFSGPAPQFKMQDAKGLEKERADRDAVLINAGAVRLTEQYLLSNYDFEEGDIEVPEQVVPSPVTPPNGTQPEGTNPGGPEGEPEDEEDMGQFAAIPGVVELAAPIKGVREGQRFSADQELVEALAEAAIVESPQPIPTSAILAAIQGAATPEELDERLAALYRGNDAGEFRELVERALFAADVIGYATAEKRIGE